MTTTTISRAVASFPVQVLKAEESADGKTGKVSAIVSAFDVPYSMGASRHRISARTFADSLGKLPIFWAHSWDGPGNPPIGSGTASIAKTGIRVDSHFYIDNEHGLAVYRALKDGAIREWSIGYFVHDYTVDDDGVWDISRGELIEASVVMRGANPNTETLKVAGGNGNTSALDRVLDTSRRAELETLDMRVGQLQDEDRRRRIRERLGDDSQPGTVALDALMADMAEHCRSGADGAERVWRLSVDDSETFLAAIEHPLKGQPEFLVDTAHQPVPRSPWDIMIKQDHREGHAKIRNLTRGGFATEASFGNPLPLLPSAATGSAEELARIGAGILRDADELEDAGSGTPDTQRLLSDACVVGFGNALVGGTGQLIGITNVDGIQELDASALTPTVALSRAAGMVMLEDFAPPLSVVAHPTTLAETLLGRVRDEAPDISSYVPSTHLSPGEIIVGDFTTGGIILWQGLQISATVSHADNFTRRVYTFVAESRMFAWWRFPSAFVLVSGLS